MPAASGPRGKRRRVLIVELAGHASRVRGPGARDLILDVTSRAPMWISRTRSWSIQEKSARDVIAAAEARGYDIVVTG